MIPHTSDMSGLSPLPRDFRPSENEFIIGRGKKVAKHCGNRKFREYIESLIPEYLGSENKSQASIKTWKTAMIYRVLYEMKDQSPETGGFVKQDLKTGEWFAVEETTARSTIAQSFRDANSTTYKSSKQFKQQRRRDQKYTSSPCGVSKQGPISPEQNGKTIGTPAMATPMLFSDSATMPHRVSIDHVDGQKDTNTDMSMAPMITLKSAALQEATALKSATARKGASELDLEALWANLRVQNSNDENPFEPNPILPASRPQLASSSMSFIEDLFGKENYFDFGMPEEV